jgi:hypothetical protein
MSSIRRAASIILAFMIVLAASSCGSVKRTRDSTQGAGAAEGADSIGGSAASAEGTSGQRVSSGTSGVPEIFPARDSYLTDSRWGYIDKAGMFVIQPSFSQAFRFQSNGRAVAGRGDKVGLIDRTGSFITEPVYSYINEYKEGLAVAVDDTGYVVLDINGKAISDKYQYISDYSGERAAFSVRGQDGSAFYGYLDQTGKPVIEPCYMSVTAFEAGRAMVKLADGVHAIIDRDGKTIKTLDIWQAAGFSDGIAAFSVYPGGKFGYMDTEGNVAIKPAFTSAGDFVDGRAAAAVPGNGGSEIYGLIDRKGRFVILPQYNEIILLGEERAALGVPRDPNNTAAGYKYALADYDGKLLTDFEFSDIGRFSGGIAYAVDNTSTFFIDRSGKRVESMPSAEGAGRLEKLNGLIAADIDQRLFYINEQGHVVYRPLSCMGTGSGVRVCEGKYKPNVDYIVYYPVLGDMADMKKEPEVNRKLMEMWTDISTLSVKPDAVLDHHYEGGFSVVYSKKNLLVIMESGYDYPFGAAHGMPVMNHVHIDARTGEFYELEDLFLDDSGYEDILSEIVGEQIADMTAQDPDIYWTDSYDGIRRDQQFYITDEGLNLYFQPYEIAPYAAGFPTFMVTFEEISDIIDKKGDFWRSFN